MILLDLKLIVAEFPFFYYGTVKQFYLAIFLFLYWIPAKAQLIDLSVFSFNDSFKTDATNISSRAIFDVGIGTLMGKSESWLWGLNFGSGSFSDKNANTTTTFTISDIGIKLGLFWTKQKSWFNTITYNIQSNAKYNDGTNSADLRGTSIKADVGYSFWPSDTLGIAIKIVYYAPSFKESVTSGNLSTVNYTRTLIYPSLSLIVSY